MLVRVTALCDNVAAQLRHKSLEIPRRPYVESVQSPGLTKVTQMTSL